LAFADFDTVKDVETAIKRSGMKVGKNTIFVAYETKSKKTRAEKSQEAKDAAKAHSEVVGREVKVKSTASEEARKERRKKNRENKKKRKNGELVEEEDEEETKKEKKSKKAKKRGRRGRGRN